MITTELLTDHNAIKKVVPECNELAETENAALPFQYIHMPIAWWETFSSAPDELFWKKRGKNFLGVQSRLVKFFLLLVRQGTKLCGVVPLVEYALKVPGSQNEMQLITLAGDYVLHPFQDFVIAQDQRQLIITAMFVEIAKLRKKEKAVFWAGCLPEDSPNLNAIRNAGSFLQGQDTEILEAISCQRGGVWPWTLYGISSTLKKISATYEKSGENIEGLAELTAKFAGCSSQALLFPRTRTNLLQEIEAVLPSIRESKNMSELAGELDSLLHNSPMLYPYIELPDDREAYLSTLSYSTRRYFRRYTRKYFAAGGSFEEVLPENITDIDIEDYIRLHLLRWGDDSAAICGQAADYHRKISRAMAEQGLFRLFFANYQGQRIAVHSCFDIGSRREGYITGVDPNFEELRAGRLLYIHTIYDAIDKGLTRYELGAVGFEYKMSFVKKTAAAHNFFLYPVGENARLDQIFTGFECMDPVRGN